MPFHIIRNDITKIHADALVNSANPKPIYDRGTDYAIYTAAGAEELLEDRRLIGEIKRGEVAVTRAYRLNAKYIIHAVGPEWEYGAEEEYRLLRNCYHNSLYKARELECESIAFPLISTGVYGFPKDEALRIAISEIKEFLRDNEMDITLVVFDEKSFELSGQIYDDIVPLIDSMSVKEQERREYALRGKKRTPSLDDMMEQVGVSFQEKLFEIIDKRGLSNKEVYTRANLDRKHFSKIQCNADYHPKKNTALALCIALELSMEESKDLLSRAEWAFNPNSISDVIVAYFIKNREYDIAKVNLALFKYHQQTLGV